MVSNSQTKIIVHPPGKFGHVGIATPIISNPNQDSNGAAIKSLQFIQTSWDILY